MYADSYVYKQDSKHRYKYFVYILEHENKKKKRQLSAVSWTNQMILIIDYPSLFFLYFWHTYNNDLLMFTSHSVDTDFIVQNNSAFYPKYQKLPCGSHARI